MTMHLRGVLLREQQSDKESISVDVVQFDSEQSYPLLLNFDGEAPLGTAHITRTPAGLEVDAVIDDMDAFITVRNEHRFLSIGGVMVRDRNHAKVTKVDNVVVAIVKENTDKWLPPYHTVECDIEGRPLTECPICGTDYAVTGRDCAGIVGGMNWCHL